MKALVKTQIKDEFILEEREIPRISEDEILIKVEYCGVCGSDLHAASHAKGYEFVPKPIILGHEFSGIVTKVASKHNEHLLNKRVIVVPGVFCGECEQCKSGRENICINVKGIGLMSDGGMAEYVKVHANQIIETPNDLPQEIAALTEPFSVAIHAVERLGDKIENKNVLVQGCGIIGMFTAIAAKSKGANVTISGLERDWEHRLSRAETFGISTEIFEKLDGNATKYDYLFECSGSSIATENAISRLKKGGEMVLVALYEQKVEFPMNTIVRGEINVLSSYGSTIKDFHSAIEVLRTNKEEFSNLIQVYQIEEGENAFIDAKEQKVLKPIIQP